MPGHSRPQEGCGLSSKGDGQQLKGLNKPGEGRDLIHIKGSLRLPCKEQIAEGQELKQEVQLEGTRLSVDRIKLRQKQMNMEQILELEPYHLLIDWMRCEQAERERKTKNASKSTDAEINSQS